MRQALRELALARRAIRANIVQFLDQLETFTKDQADRLGLRTKWRVTAKGSERGGNRSRADTSTGCSRTDLHRPDRSQGTVLAGTASGAGRWRDLGRRP